MITKKKRPLNPGKDQRPQIDRTQDQNTLLGSEGQGVGATDNSAYTQRKAILSFLCTHGSMTTLEARQVLGVCAPAARVMELRRKGHKIETVWTDDIDSTGKIHRVARYVKSFEPNRDNDSLNGEKCRKQGG